MSHSEGERPGGDCLLGDLSSLSPSVATPKVVELALQAFLKKALREHSLRTRRDCFKAFPSTTPSSDSIGFDLAGQ